ncbi:MAG: tetratricopeptide repeat protein, partial [Candidatus Zixiibacteriota bacterium]
FGYELLGHRIIDMVGLTDTTIARHPQEPIAGITTTWKEQNFNAAYVLSQSPDYILFSTGRKPSAPGEKALHLYQQFFDAYKIVDYAQMPGPYNRKTRIHSVYRRFREITGELVPVYPVAFVEYYTLGLERHNAGDLHEAIQWHRKAIETCPHCGNVNVLYDLAYCCLLTGETDYGVNLLDSVVARDSLMAPAHRVLFRHAVLTGDTARAAIHRRWVGRLSPWELPRLDAQAVGLLRKQGQ